MKRRTEVIATNANIRVWINCDFVLTTIYRNVYTWDRLLNSLQVRNNRIRYGRGGKSMNEKVTLFLELNEPYAAGFFEEEDKGLFTRFSRAQRRYF